MARKWHNPEEDKNVADMGEGIPLKFDCYTIRIEFGGYWYTIKREGPGVVEHTAQPAIVMGESHAVVLHDDKNSWYVGQCDTIKQALVIIGRDLLRHAGQMAEMAQYDTEPTPDDEMKQRLGELGYHTTAVADIPGEYVWVNKGRSTNQLFCTACTSNSHEAAWEEARLDAIREGLLPAGPNDSTDPIGY